MPAARRDVGGIVLGWLFRVALALGLLGVLAYDTLSLTYTNVMTVDNAKIVALAGSDELSRDPRDLKGALAASRAQASELGVRLKAKDWWVDDQGVVHVTVSSLAPTLVLRHVPPMRPYLTVRAVGTAGEL